MSMSDCTMESPPPPPPSLPTSSPFGTITGYALDVIVVVPPPPISRKRRQSSLKKYDNGERDTQCLHCSSKSDDGSAQSEREPGDSSQYQTPAKPETTAAPQAVEYRKHRRSKPPPAKGVIASSDFYVSFPSSAKSGAAPVLSVARQFSSFFSRSSSNTSDRGSSHGSLDDGDFGDCMKSTDLISENSSGRSISTHERIDEGEEVEFKEPPLKSCDDGGEADSSEPIRVPQQEQMQRDEKYDVHQTNNDNLEQRLKSQNQSQQNQNHFQQQKSQQQQQQPMSPPHIRFKRASNVKLQINGRYIPELDMIFARRSSIVGGGRTGNDNSGKSDDSTDTTCRFVDGNDLRPCTETLNMLVGRQSGEHDENDSTEENNNRTPSQIIEAGQGQKAILHFGRNLLRYTLYSRKGNVLGTAEAYLYLWSACDSVIVSDVDGTVTKSDVRGVIDTVIQDNFQHVHSGICRFFHRLVELGRGANELDGSIKPVYNCEQFTTPDLPMREGNIRFLYLSSRPISLVYQTRKLLLSVCQESEETTASVANLMSTSKFNLPPGPILCHTGPLSSVLYSELVAKNIYQFKADMLARQVVLPFVAARGEEWKYRQKMVEENGRVCSHTNMDKKLTKSFSEASSDSEGQLSWDNRLFLAGFGNKTTDAEAYEMAGMDRRDIYIINKESRILCMGGNKNPHPEGDDGLHRSISVDSAKLSMKESCLSSEVGWSLGDSCCDVEDVVRRSVSSPSAMTVTFKDMPTDSIMRTDSKYTAPSIPAIELALSDERPPGGSIMSTAAVDISVTTELNPTDTSSNIHTSQVQSSADYSPTKLKRPSLLRKSKRKSFRKVVREFTSVKTLTTFPSFASVASGKPSDDSSLLYNGYNDPRLLEAVRERMLVLHI